MTARRFAVPVLVLALVVLLGSSAVVGPVRPAVAAPGDPPADAGVAVQGVGTATGTPDVLRFTVGVEVTEGTVGEALAAADAAALRLLQALRANGVAEPDVQTVHVGLHPRFDDDGQDVTGYVARQDVSVTVRELDRAGATIGAAVEAAGNAARLHGVSYALEDDTAVQAEARAEAFASARRKAEQYAELTGRGLGDVVRVREQVGGSGPHPMAMADAAAAEAVPIAPGSAEVVVTVEVRWALT